MSNQLLNGRAMSSVAASGVLRAVIPSDVNDLPLGATRAVFAAAGGALVVTGADGETVTIGSAANQYHPICVRRIHATGTTADGIVALY